MGKFCLCPYPVEQKQDEVWFPIRNHNEAESKREVIVWFLEIYSSKSLTQPRKSSFNYHLSHMTF